MSLRLIEPATALAVTLAEAKAHLRVSDTTDDARITGMIHTATATAEQAMGGRAIMEQTWELSLNSFSGLILTRPPVISIESVKYVDTAGVTQTLAASAYRLRVADDYSYPTVEPAYGTEWPETLEDIDVVKVSYLAGYEDGVPYPIKSWILLQIGSLFANAETEATGSGSVVKFEFADRTLDRYVIRA